MNNPSQILVFRTNLNGSDEINRIRPALNGHRLIRYWSVDTEDIDKVLRVVTSSSLNEAEIIQMLTQANFQCGELE